MGLGDRISGRSLKDACEDLSSSNLASAYRSGIIVSNPSRYATPSGGFKSLKGGDEGEDEPMASRHFCFSCVSFHKGIEVNHSHCDNLESTFCRRYGHDEWIKHDGRVPGCRRWSSRSKKTKKK